MPRNLRIALFTSVALHALIGTFFFNKLLQKHSTPQNRTPELTIRLGASISTASLYPNSMPKGKVILARKNAGTIAPPPLPETKSDETISRQPQLDIKPKLLNVPLSITPSPVSLRVRLRIFVDRKGFVVDVQSLDSDIDEDYLLGLKTLFKQSNFSPAQRDGLAVDSTIDIEVEPKETTGNSQSSNAVFR